MGPYLRDKNACKFEECITVAAEDGYCPRHSLLVGQVGYEKAVIIERDYACPECKERVDEPKDCQHCGSKRCLACAATRECCMRRIREMEEEAERLDGEADAMRDEAEDLRSSMAEVDAK